MGPRAAVGLTVPSLVVVVALAVVLSSALCWLIVSFAVRRGGATTGATRGEPRPEDPDSRRG